MVSVMEIDILE